MRISGAGGSGGCGMLIVFRKYSISAQYKTDFLPQVNNALPRSLAGESPHLASQDGELKKMGECHMYLQA
jgi:hypothetical protein